MSYSKIEQETYIHFDVDTGETTVYSTYAPDIRYYLKLADEGGLELIDTETEDGRIISLSAKLLQGYTLSRKPKKKRVYTDEERAIMSQRLATIRQK